MARDSAQRCRLMNWLQLLAETKVFGITIHPWKIVGLSGSLIFGLRFLIQWIASERARKSVIPFGFWECSARRFTAAAGLLRALSARFGRRASEHLAASHLPPKSIL